MRTFLAPDEQETLVGATFTLTWPNQSSCDPVIWPATFSWIPGVDVPSGYSPWFQLYGAQNGVPFDVEFDIAVSPSVDASFNTGHDGVEKIMWMVPDSCLANPVYVCVVASDDTPIWQGEVGNQGTWRHQMDDLSADFEGREVRERMNNPLATDGCWDNAVALGMDQQVRQTCTAPVTGPTGWVPPLDDTNTTTSLVLDHTGYDSTCVAAYQSVGATPCVVSVVQPMQMKCAFPGGDEWKFYQGYVIKQRILANGTTEHSKTGTPWYP